MKIYSIWYDSKERRSFSLNKGTDIPCYANGTPQTQFPNFLISFKAKHWTNAKKRFLKETNSFLKAIMREEDLYK